MKREFQRYLMRLLVYGIPLAFFTMAVRMHHDSAGNYTLTAFGKPALSWKMQSVERYIN